MNTYVQFERWIVGKQEATVYLNFDIFFKVKKFKYI